MRNRLNLGLLVALVATVALNLVLVRNPSRRNLEVFPDMVHPVSF